MVSLVKIAFKRYELAKFLHAETPGAVTNDKMTETTRDEIIYTIAYDGARIEKYSIVCASSWFFFERGKRN